MQGSQKKSSQRDLEIGQSDSWCYNADLLMDSRVLMMMLLLLLEVVKPPTKGVARWSQCEWL